MNTTNRIMRKGLGVLGVVSSLFSLMFVVFAIADLIGGNDKTGPDILIGLLVFFAGTCIASAFLARWGFQASKPPGLELGKDESIRQILRMAQHQQGELSLLEVAAETQLSIDQSKELLEDLVASRLAQMHIRQDGVMLYVFPEFRPEIPPDYHLPGE
jgi:hypothetical protein